MVDCAIRRGARITTTFIASLFCRSHSRRCHRPAVAGADPGSGSWRLSQRAEVRQHTGRVACVRMPSGWADNGRYCRQCGRAPDVAVHMHYTRPANDGGGADRGLAGDPPLTDRADSNILRCGSARRECRRSRSKPARVHPAAAGGDGVAARLARRSNRIGCGGSVAA